MFAKIALICMMLAVAHGLPAGLHAPIAAVGYAAPAAIAQAPLGYHAPTFVNTAPIATPLAAPIAAPIATYAAPAPLTTVVQPAPIYAAAPAIVRPIEQHGYQIAY